MLPSEGSSAPGREITDAVVIVHKKVTSCIVPVSDMINYFPRSDGAKSFGCFANGWRKASR